MAEIETEITRSSRDRAELRNRLEEWLRSITGDRTASMGAITSPEANGMSSETLLFDADLDGSSQRLVARVAPDLSDVPVFPTYDLELQYRVMVLVKEQTTVPVPATRWIELDESVLGAPFFVMDRVEGRAAPDVPPYTFEGWLSDATDEQRDEVERNALGLLAGIHSIDVSSVDTSFLELDRPGDSPLRRHVAEWDAYHEWVRGDRVHPILEAGREWLESNWPKESSPVISWGDSRIGNVLWDGFDPAAVLDWEMAGIGPRELDLSWMIFLHDFFQGLAETFELPGLPGFMDRDRASDTYAERSGIEPVDLHWYLAYAAWRHGIIMARVHARSVHFGQAEWTDDVDAPILHRHQIAELIGA